MHERESLQSPEAIPEALTMLDQRYKEILKRPVGKRDYNPLFDYIFDNIAEIVAAGIYTREGESREALKRKVKGLGEKTDVKMAIVLDLKQSHDNNEHERVIRDIAVMRVFDYEETSPTFVRQAAPLEKYHRTKLAKSQQSTEPSGAYEQTRKAALRKTWPERCNQEKIT